MALIQFNIREQILEQMPSEAPSFFFVDIQNEQMDRFRELANSIPGVTEIRDVPSLRAKVVAIKGVPVEQADVTPDTAWALKGDRGLTYAATPPEHTRLVAGQWWPADYDGPPLVSFDADMAKGWHVGSGRHDPGQRARPGHRSSRRQPARHRVAKPVDQLLHGRQSRHIVACATHAYRDRTGRSGARGGIVALPSPMALPNVTGIRVADVLAAISTLLDQIANALAATGLLTLLAGLLVLVSAVTAGQRRRTREAIILRVLGATSGQIRAAWLVEFGLLGLAAGLIAALVGGCASFGVAQYILRTPWVFSWRILILTLAGGLATMLVFGYAGLNATSRARPAQLLRNE